MSEWMTVRQIAEETGISTSGVRKLLVKDEVPILRLSGIWKIKRSEFEALMARRYGK